MENRENVNFRPDFANLAEREKIPICKLPKKLADRPYIVGCNQHANACL
jgi:hypothetical protein